MKQRSLTIFLLAFSLLAVVLTACSTGGSGELAVEDAWVRPAPMPGGNGAGYLVINNGTDTDDALVSANADFAQAVEIHESMALEGDMMSMQPVDSVPAPAGESVRLEPGGYHIMLIGIDEQLQEGDTVTLTLTFQNAGEMTIEAPVREE